MNGIQLLRLDKTCDRAGGKKTRLYEQIKQGVFAPPVAIGGRAVAWVEHEVDAVLRARVAGVPEDGIRHLVSELVSARAQVATMDGAGIQRMVGELVAAAANNTSRA